MANDGGHEWTSWSQVSESAWRRDCLKCGEFERLSMEPPLEHGGLVSSDEIAQLRDHAAEGRDLRAENRDRVADVRDARADARDEAAGVAGEVTSSDRAASRSELGSEAQSACNNSTQRSARTASTSITLKSSANAGCWSDAGRVSWRSRGGGLVQSCDGDPRAAGAASR